MRGAATFALPTKPDIKVMQDAPMSLHTTWRIGGPAQFLVRAASPEAMLAALEWADREDLTTTVIGGGSNLLAPDAGIQGLVILSRTPGEPPRTR